MQDVSKRALPWYSKSYCVASVTKAFTLKGIQTIGDGGFYSSTQRHYRRLIYYVYIILLHVSVIRPSSCKNILIARVTQLTTDPLFYNIANIIMIVLYSAAVAVWVWRVVVKFYTRGKVILAGYRNVERRSHTSAVSSVNCNEPNEAVVLLIILQHKGRHRKTRKEMVCSNSSDMHCKKQKEQMDCFFRR
jgi:hypothetical protein